MVSVRCAFFTPGSRKALTPLLTASTPVIAVQPLEKALSRSQSVTACVAAGGAGSAISGAGCPPGARTRKSADSDGDASSADKKIRRKHESQAGFAHAAEIQDGDDDENADAQGDHVWMQARDGGDERADSGGDTDRRGEYVVGEQGRGGEQAGERAEIEARDRVRAAAVGISGDRLAIRKVNNDQQNDDGGADRKNVVKSDEAQRDEKAERGFGAIRGGAERVEAEDGNAAAGADLLGALFAGGERFADEEVEDVHEWRGSMCGCVWLLFALRLPFCVALSRCDLR